MDNPTRMDDLGVPLVWETSIYPRRNTLDNQVYEAGATLQ